MHPFPQPRAGLVLSIAALAGVAGLAAAEPPGFDRTLELDGVRFRVSSPNASSINRVTIAPEGLEIDDSPINRDIEGAVTGAEVADLDSNGSPEIYVFVTSAGSGSYGTLVAYAANNRKSLSEIYLPPLADADGNAGGYMGHDSFMVAGNRLVRRYPIYRPGDTNNRPTGGTKELRYALVAGEAGWLLHPEDESERDDLEPFPAPGDGMRRFVIRLPGAPAPEDRRVEVQVGRTIQVDCNRHSFAATVTRKVAEGWGYPYFLIGELTGPIATRRACPPGEPVRTEFVRAAAGELESLPYNAALPIVVYVPRDVEVRYRVWVAGEPTLLTEPQ